MDGSNLMQPGSLTKVVFPVENVSGATCVGKKRAVCINTDLCWWTCSLLQWCRCLLKVVTVHHDITAAYGRCRGLTDWTWFIVPILHLNLQHRKYDAWQIRRENGRVKPAGQFPPSRRVNSVKYCRAASRSWQNCTFIFSHCGPEWSHACKTLHSDPWIQFGCICICYISVVLLFVIGFVQMQEICSVFQHLNILIKHISRSVQTIEETVHKWKHFNKIS